MLKLPAVLTLLAAAAPLTAQIAICNKPPTKQMLASATTANHILEKVIPKDALDLNKFRKEAQKDVDQHPNDPFALAVLGNIQFRSGDLETSIATLNRSMQIFPCIAYVHFTAAKYYALTGDNTSAQQQIELAHALAPNVPEIASEWTHTHTSPSDRSGISTQLQRRNVSLSAKPTGLKPFGGQPDRPLLAPVTREIVLTLEKSGPPTQKVPRAVVRQWSDQINTLNPDDVPTLTISINGHPVRLLLNLYGDGFFLTSTAARRVGITDVSYSSASADLNITGLDLPNTPLTISDRPEHAANSPTAFTDGTVGLYFFSRSLIKLDLWGGKLTLSPLPAQSPLTAASDRADHWSPLYVLPGTHQLLVSAQTGNTTPHLFLLALHDTYSAIAPDTANGAEDVHRFEGGAGHWGTNSIRIWIGGKTVELDHPDVLPEPRFPDLGMGISGRIGREDIHGIDLTFDYRDHLMKVN